MTTFNMHFDAGSMQGKNVLVFLKPQNPQADYFIHAWQVLSGSTGSTESFNYVNTISTDVTSYGNKANEIVSKRETIQPGQLLQAISPSGLSPLLQPADSSVASEKLTSNQCGVINKTTPYIQFDSNWYVNDKPVVTMPYVDGNMTCSFDFEPKLYFMVAAPPMKGQTYTVQSFSDMTPYQFPTSATNVDIVVNRLQGIWDFQFTAD